jgi:hypothetical protein
MGRKTLGFQSTKEQEKGMNWRKIYYSFKA